MLKFCVKTSCKADFIDEHTYVELILMWSFDIHVYLRRIYNLFIRSQSLSVEASSHNIYLYDINDLLIKFHFILSPNYKKNLLTMHRHKKTAVPNIIMSQYNRKLRSGYQTTWTYTESVAWLSLYIQQPGVHSLVNDHSECLLNVISGITDTQ